MHHLYINSNTRTHMLHLLHGSTDISIIYFIFLLRSVCLYNTNIFIHIGFYACIICTAQRTSKTAPLFPLSYYPRCMVFIMMYEVKTSVSLQGNILMDFGDYPQ